MIEYETPRAMRWWETFPWKRLLVAAGLNLVVLVVAFVIIYLARSG